MSEHQDNHEGKEQHTIRKQILVVVDGSEEMETALFYAARRALYHGDLHIALLYVIEEEVFTHWMGVGKLMQEELREQADETLRQATVYLKQFYKKEPIIYVRAGVRKRDVLFDLLEEKQGEFYSLILATTLGRGAPGPLISDLVGKFVGRLKIPLEIVPGDFSKKDMSDLT